MIIQFSYYGEERVDKRPLILFLYHDRTKKLVHGINLNYIYDYEVQQIFDNAAKITKVKMENESILSEKEYTRILIPRSRSEQTTKKLYENIIKPTLIEYDIYRTYKPAKIRRIKLVTYKLGRGKITKQKL